MTGQAGIYYGSATTESTYFFPSATVEAWNAYIATATANTTANNGASSMMSMGSVWSMKLIQGSLLAIVLGMLL